MLKGYVLSVTFYQILFSEELFIYQVTGYHSWFNIVYDEDPAVYTYQLMKDFNEECLKITVN